MKPLDRSAQRPFQPAKVRVGSRLHVELGLVVLLGALADDHVRPAAAHQRIVRVACPIWRLEGPRHREPGVHALDGIHRLAVAVVRQRAFVVELALEAIREVGGSCDLLVLRPVDPRRPMPGAKDRHLGSIVDPPATEARPQHQIDQVGGDVDEALALLGGVEVPGGPADRLAGDVLEEMVHAFFDDRGIVGRASFEFAEDLRVEHELLLQDAQPVETLGHDVVEQQPFALGVVEGPLQLGESRRIDAHRLVGEDVQARIDRGGDILGLAAVVARQNHDAARFVGLHPFEVVGSDIDLLLPTGRLIRAAVEAFDPSEVLLHFRPVGGIDVDHRVDLLVHRLLDESGVVMPRIENDQPDGPPGAPGRPGASARRRTRQRNHQQTEAYNGQRQSPRHG